MSAAPDARRARGEHWQRLRRGWVLALGLASFGTLALMLFWSTFPSGWRGLARAGILVGLLVLIGGLIAPLITRALTRR